MAPLTFRDARPEDLEAVVAIYNAAVPGRKATADTEPVPVQSRRAWFERHGGNRPLWIAERDGEIAGWLSFEDFYGRPAYARTAEVSIYVHPAHQGAGVGQALLERAIDQAPGLGLHVLVGYVFGHNDASLALFERFGFSRWGELPRLAELDGTLADVVIVGREL